MFYDEDYLSPTVENVAFDLQQSPIQTAAFTLTVAHLNEVQMSFNQPIQLGKPGLMDALLVSDQEGLIRAWV